MSLTKLPAMPTSRKPGATTKCECGCGGDTSSRFVPGHDARLKGWVIRVLRGIVTVDWIRAKASKGEAEAVQNALNERTLAGVKWADELAAQKARLAKEAAAKQTA